MATTTTNYGFDIPQSTDLVKDGATAIATLGQDIDTAMNTALGTKKAGMVLLNTTSFSGVASQSLNNVFSATYDNYRIVCYLETTSIANLGIRLRVAGVDNSTASSYINQLINGASSGVTAQRLVSSQWSEFIYINASSEINSFIFDLQKPFLATQTAGQQQGGRDNNLTIGQLRHNQSTSYDGFTMIPSSGNITGKVSVYGYSL